MIFQVRYKCKVDIFRFEKNYSGTISVCPAGNSVMKTFYYLCLDPYGGRSAEFSLFADPRKGVPYAEALGKQIEDMSPKTGTSIKVFDFSSIENDAEKSALTFFAVNIVLDCIHKVEIRYRKMVENLDPSAKALTTVEFNELWKTEMAGDVEKHMIPFLKSFGIHILP